MNDPFVPGLLSRLPEPPHKIILLRASRIGDFLCATPAFRALRKALPGTEITMITLPMLQDLVMRSPDLDRFVAFPGFPGIAEQFFDACRTIHFFPAKCDSITGRGGGGGHHKASANRASPSSPYTISGAPVSSVKSSCCHELPLLNISD